jgi:hypothetical protein
MSYTCEFCKKDFFKESSVAVHMCESKRRRLEQHEAGVRLGFQAYVKFYETMQGSARNKTFEDFADSPYYRAFVKWGRYCVNTRVINPSQFLIWLLRAQKKIDNWCSDKLYTEYLLDYLLLEAPQDALERALSLSLDWQERTTHPSHDMLRYGNHNALCHDIVAGRLSAWCIYNSESGQEFLSQLNSEQIAMVWPYIDSDRWQSKFRNYMADQEWVKDLLKKAGW